MPLLENVKKGAVWCWGKKQQDSFEVFKMRITEEPVLRFSNFDRHFSIFVDTSDQGIGVVLSQLYYQEFHRPVQYFSRTLSPA